jgi:hypothetical protein
VVGRTGEGGTTQDEARQDRIVEFVVENFVNLLASTYLLYVFYVLYILGR